MKQQQLETTIGQLEAQLRRLKRAKRNELEDCATLTAEALDYYKSQMPPEWKSYAEVMAAVVINQNKD